MQEHKNITAALNIKRREQSGLACLNRPPVASMLLLTHEILVKLQCVKYDSEVRQILSQKCLLQTIMQNKCMSRFCVIFFGVS